ncbi:MAG TPA: MFS transporter, partial [Steroidobacteraceae bacterium]|nr:MFS transporter [Steroidobacteraceae bacterium]
MTLRSGDYCRGTCREGKYTETAVKSQFGMDTLFMLLTGMCAIGVVGVAYLPVTSNTSRSPEQPPSHWGDVRRALLAGISARAFTSGCAFGIYLTVWPIYLTNMGASDWGVAMSWTLFAIPALVFGPWAGRLIDRNGPGTSAVA